MHMVYSVTGESPSCAGALSGLGARGEGVGVPPVGERQKGVH